MRERRFVIATTVLLLLAPGTSAFADSDADKTLSPYFFVSGEPGVDSLALKETSAEINVAGVIADVVVTQKYKNDGEKAINARYVFPASTRAAVYGMKMTVGDRTIEAKIKKRAQARAEYEAAKKEGKSASLLEQDRPNVFSMNVANIMPGDDIRVELRYTELIVPTDGVYEMVYPTVVGPRYSGAGAEIDSSDPTNKHVASAYTHSGKKPTYDFTLSARIAAGMPVNDIDSPSHEITTVTGQDNSATIALNNKDGGNRDFILRYRLAGKEIASGLMMYEGDKENFFLMMVQPPRRPKADVIPAREYIFIVDVSGSMRGFPLEVTGDLMKELFGKLRSGDSFNVMLFSAGSTLLSETSLPASQDNIDSAVALIENTPGGGGTQLLPALERAMKLPADSERSRTIIVVTDGYIAAERKAFEVVRDNLGDANVFAFGIGSGVNRYLIEGLAKAGLGTPFVATTKAEAAPLAEEFRKYVESPVLTNIKVAYDGLKVYDQQPVSVPDVFANRPVVVFGKYKGARKGTIKLTGVSGNGRFVNEFAVSDTKPLATNSALKYLWARSRIADLSDFATPGEEQEKQITALGLKYNLLTQYTSFIAVHNVVRNASADARDVDVPLPMPQGVEDSAMGGVGVGPEPGLLWLLVGMLGFAIVVTTLRRKRAGARSDR